MNTLIEVDNLHLKFVGDRINHALNGVSFTVSEGEIFGLLGESGSGKSVLLRTLMRLFPERKTQISGSIKIAGRDALTMNSKELRAIRGGVISMVFQESGLAFDPVYTIGQQISEAIICHEGVSKKEAGLRALQMLDLVRIPAAKQRINAFPFELSGGMRQRAMIAMALACKPKILLADEPTTALDPSVQMQILLLLRELQKELGMSIIFVTHDTGVTAEICDRVAVMYGGQIVESGPIEQIMSAPLHPYLNGLLASSVKDSKRGDRLQTIAGSPPILNTAPIACSFMPRCKIATQRCASAIPPMLQLRPNHNVRCVQYE